MRRFLTPLGTCFLTGLMLAVLMLYWLVSSHALSLTDLPGGRRAWYPLLALWTSRLQLLRLCAFCAVLAQMSLWLWLMERSGILAWLLAWRFKRLESCQPDALRFGLLAFLAGSLSATVVQHLGLGLDSLAILINVRSIVFKLLAGGLLGFAALTAFRGASKRLRVACPAAALGLGLALSLLPWQGFLEPFVFGTEALRYGPWSYLLWSASCMGAMGIVLALLAKETSAGRTASSPDCSSLPDSST